MEEEDDYDDFGDELEQALGDADTAGEVSQLTPRHKVVAEEAPAATETCVGCMQWWHAACRHPGKGSRAAKRTWSSHRARAASCQFSLCGSDRSILTSPGGRGV